MPPQEAHELAAEYRTPKWGLGQASSSELAKFFAYLKKLLRTLSVFAVMMPSELSSTSPPPHSSAISSSSFNSLNALVLEMVRTGMVYLYHESTSESTGIRYTLFPLSELMETIVQRGVPVAASLAAALYANIITRQDSNDFFSLSPRFFDILSKFATPPMMPSEDPSLVQIIMRNILDAATPNRPSAKFWSTGFLDLNDDISKPADASQLAHPFYVCFPRPSTYRSLYFYRVQGSPHKSPSLSSSPTSSPALLPTEIIVVYTTAKRDPDLWSFRETILEAEGSMPGEEDKAPPISLPNSERATFTRLQRLADRVALRLPITTTPWPKVLQKLQENSSSSLIPLGALAQGLPRHRAILYKYCCDLLQLPCQLCRAPRVTGSSSSHLWNVAFDGIRSWVVDFRGVTAAMMPHNSPEAVSYTTPEDATTEDRNDIHNWLSKWRSGQERVLRHIGAGAFGAVESVEITVPGMDPRIIARKTLKPGKTSIIRAIWLEAQALLFLKHPNILEFYCASINFEKCKAIFYSELCDGSLSDILKKPEYRISITVGRWSQLLLGLLGALAYMHSHSFVHRDIKPGNILLKFAPDNRNHITSLKLADFGLARNFRYTKLNSLAGTPGWRPPEVVTKSTQRMPEKSDIYGFGLLFALCLMNQGTSPWGSLRTKKPDGTMAIRSDADSIPFQFIMRQLQAPGILSTLPSGYISFLQDCLNPSWSERLSAPRAVSDLQLLLVSHPDLFYISTTPPIRRADTASPILQPPPTSEPLS